MKEQIPYCPTCNEAKKRKIYSSLHKQDILVHRQCACERAYYKKEEARHKKQEHEIVVTQNQSVCFKQKKMLECTFENDNGKTPAMSYARKYVAGWNQVKAENAGLLLWGGIGSGKTYMAACIANALLQQEKKVLMTDFTTVSNKSLYDMPEFVRSLDSYELLIIDDLGAERSSEFALQNVYDVINSRYNSGKPLLLTTNFNISQIKNEENETKKRIYDQILGMCTPVFVDGKSKRIDIASTT